MIKLILTGVDLETKYAYDTMPYSNVSSLDALMDNTYDTPLDGSSTDYDVDFMPSLGIGLGYRGVYNNAIYGAYGFYDYQRSPEKPFRFPERLLKKTF